MRYLIISTLLLFELSSAQTVLYPLQVGNRWFYERYVFYTPVSYSYESKVVGDTTFTNGKRYAVRDYSDGYAEYLRQDGERVYGYTPYDSTECILYQFDLQYGDSIFWSVLMGQHPYTVFGKPLWAFVFSDYTPGFGEAVGDSIGEIEYGYDLGINDRLTGAVINGFAYGVLNVASDNNLVQPANYHLAQNYPNPFNASTTIRYDVPRSFHVALTVYNLLGQHVATLVDEQESPGTYTAQFNGADLPSGVNFYRLTAGEATLTKKLVLMK